jgi:hypothetical protein
MERLPRHKFDLYTEFYPASSVAIIGCGIITATMGAWPVGVSFVLSGMAVGMLGPIARAVHERKIATARRRRY